MKAVHIACGAGGITLGFERAGIKTALAFDIEPVVIETHRRNFPEAPAEVIDLRRVRAVNLPPAEVWVCGIPCEPYSLAGLRNQGADSRDISLDLARLLREADAASCAPQYVFLENVPPFARSDEANEMRRALERYNVFEAVFVHADYGVCQKRKRWHLIAARTGAIPLPEPTHTENGPDLFGRLPWVKFAAIRDCGGRTPVSATALRGMFRRLARSAAKGNAFVPQIITDDDLLATVLTTWGKGASRSQAVLVWEDGRLRMPSMLEARRAQGFADDFVFCGTVQQQWEQVARAVPPSMAEAVAKAMIKTLSER